MTTQRDTTQPAGGSPVERPVGRPAQKREAFERWCSVSGHGTLDDMMMPLERALKNLLWTAWTAAWDSQQAAIDRLMLEHCPGEMTPEQVSEWALHQVPVVERAFAAMQQREAARISSLPPGTCEQCEGAGGMGGQFCGGMEWTCEACGGTGRTPNVI